MLIDIIIVVLFLGCGWMFNLVVRNRRSLLQLTEMMARYVVVEKREQELFDEGYEQAWTECESILSGMGVATGADTLAAYREKRLRNKEHIWAKDREDHRGN